MEPQRLLAEIEHGAKSAERKPRRELNVGFYGWSSDREPLSLLFAGALLREHHFQLFTDFVRFLVLPLERNKWLLMLGSCRSPWTTSPSNTSQLIIESFVVHATRVHLPCRTSGDNIDHRALAISSHKHARSRCCREDHDAALDARLAHVDRARAHCGTGRMLEPILPADIGRAFGARIIVGLRGQDSPVAGRPACA
jgi:hypothetical protein